MQDDILRWHPLFLEFLREELERFPRERRGLLARAGKALLEENQTEDAADLLFAAGETELATQTAEAALGGLLLRGDWEKALRWIGRMDPAVPARRPAVRAAQLRALYMGRHQAETTTLVEEMVASGELAALARTVPDLAAFAIWGLHEGGRWTELQELLPPPGVSPLADAFRYCLACGTSAVPVDPPPIPGRAEYTVVVPIQMGLLYQGRLAATEEAGRAAEDQDVVTRALAALPRVTALTRSGERERARGLMESVAEPLRASLFAEFWLSAEAEILFEEGDVEEALLRIDAASGRARELGYRVGEHGFFPARQGRMLVRAGRFEAALETLEEPRTWCGVRGVAFIREWAETWIGGALLGLGRDAEALAVLEPAAADMQSADRLLELPSAAAFLAEAAWRCGDAEGHRRASRLAVDAAGRMGTRYPLDVAIRAMPEMRGPAAHREG